MRTMMRMMIGRPIGYLSTARTRGALKEMEGVDDEDDDDNVDVDEDNQDEDDDEDDDRTPDWLSLNR